MADILLIPAISADWLHQGSKIRHIQLVDALNCRAEKEVDDQIVTLISSSCISIDSCPPFIKSYHDFAVSIELYEFIPGLGRGCLMEQGSLKYRRRSRLSDAGNFVSGIRAIANLSDAANRFISTDPAAWAVNGGVYFGANAQADLLCPDAVSGNR